MASPYSIDFRRKVIEAIELNGMKRSEVSQMFGLSRNTIYQWEQLKKKTGELEPKPRQSSGHSHKITDWQKFRAFVNQHADKTQKQMAQLWEGEVSECTISRGLKKIGYTRKKNLWVPAT